MRPSLDKTSESPQNDLSGSSVQQQLDKVLQSNVFARSDRMKRFLRFIVEQALEGETESLKEYSIAVAVFDRPEDFDPRLDPIVRVEAGRLRSKLREYYITEGRDDRIWFRCPKRSYVPIFELREPCSANTAPTRAGSLANFRSTVSIEDTAHQAEAYKLYLRGRYSWNKRTEDGLRKAIGYFERALILDPGYALAYTGLADCYAALVEFGALAPAEGWSKADEATQRSLEIDERLSQAHVLVGAKQAYFKWNWVEAEESFRRAIELNPLNSGAYQWYAVSCLVPQRRLEQALVEIKRACELDPLWPAVSSRLGWVLYLRRQFEEALAQWQTTIELDPTFYLTYCYQGCAYERLNRFDEALAAFNQANLLCGGMAFTTSALGRCYALMGRRQKALQVLETLLKLSKQTYACPVDLAGVYEALGEVAACFQWLDKAYEDRSSRLVYLKVDPAWDRVKLDPRFIKLLFKLFLAT